MDRTCRRIVREGRAADQLAERLVVEVPEEHLRFWTSEQARNRRQWLGVLARLAYLSMVIGAVGVGIAIGIDSAARAIQDTPDAGLGLALGSLGSGLLLAGIGILTVGWFVLPLTFGAALIWALLMKRFFGRANAGSWAR